MIINFKFSNFYSFAEETEVSFEVGKKVPESSYDIEVNDKLRLNKVIAVIGANGAGKTQLIRALSFLSKFITSSFIDMQPDEHMKFLCHLFKGRENSIFEIHFIIEQIEYKYRLVLNLTNIVHESLLHKTSRTFSYLFIRELNNDNSYSYKQNGFKFTAKSNNAINIRSNVSVLSAAYHLNTPIATKICQYFNHYLSDFDPVFDNTKPVPDIITAGKFFYKNKWIQPLIEKILCNHDLGLHSLAFEKFKRNDNEEIIPFAHHKAGEKSFTLPLVLESNGTISFFILLRYLLPVLQNGGVAIIDEIDNDLHPHMLPKILELFRSEETNPHNGQLIFTCHTPEILNHLRKHQIYLVEKNDLESEAWALSDIEGLRADDNFYAKYMAGALGAVPNI